MYHRQMVGTADGHGTQTLNNSDGEEGATFDCAVAAAHNAVSAVDLANPCTKTRVAGGNGGVGSSVNGTR